MPPADLVVQAAQLRATVATARLTTNQARLLSQRIRRELGQPGLAHFTPTDADNYLEDASFLIQAGLIERGAHPASEWRAAVRRGAELLEWLDKSGTLTQVVPLRLLSAAAYQVAGFPAMAAAELTEVRADEPTTTSILRNFVAGRFGPALSMIHRYWAAEIDRNPRAATTDIVRHVIVALGPICEYLRTGDDAHVGRAVAKLESLAAGLVHARDRQSFLLARLAAVCARRYTEVSLWRHLGVLDASLGDQGRSALRQMARASFAKNRALVWPGQQRGIEQLSTGSSFVLCTPTGSGKTTVAVAGIVQSLFREPADGVPDEQAGLVIYMVPSRALAAEVESRLQQDLAGVSVEPVVITGLYGGLDWGPLDAWIDSDRRTTVVCTYEKADALVRYLGVLFLHRVKLVVVDEAHSVEQSATAGSGGSRALRLEDLGTRLKTAQQIYGFRMIALSAVAERAAPVLAEWLGGPGNQPVLADHRSTRQLIGRLEVNRAGDYTISYDRLDGQPLAFSEDGRPGTPFVYRPIPAVPGGFNGLEGPEVGLRGPTLWAALNLASERPDGSKPSVLISIAQHVERFAISAAGHMASWDAAQLPRYFDGGDGVVAFRECLASLRDYFGEDSAEFRLLQRGIAVHHGKMPGVVARRLKALLDRGIVRVVVATSTLSEGVNIPVTYVLVPSLYRGQARMSAQEFANLAGRAGRPGVGTEGHVLAIRGPANDQRPGAFRERAGYDDLLLEMGRAAAGRAVAAGRSPLAELLRSVRRAWAQLRPIGTDEEFLRWLEEAVADPDGQGAETLLDSLDGFLLSAVTEAEALLQRDLNGADLELELRTLWGRTYAAVATREEARLAEFWLHRGRTIKTRFPDVGERRRIYKTGMPPRSARELLARVSEVRVVLQSGADYATRDREGRFSFVRSAIESTSTVPMFAVRDLGRVRARNPIPWADVLRWWLAKDTARRAPTAANVGDWFRFVSDSFIYRTSWGLGAVLGVLLEEGEQGVAVDALRLDDWPQSGLPWIAFWLKELLAWGTLDPVAAFLLSTGRFVDRSTAELAAEDYYVEVRAESPDEMLDPRRIRGWAEQGQDRGQLRPEPEPLQFSCVPERPAASYPARRMLVHPLRGAAGVAWISTSGHVVGRNDTATPLDLNPAAYVFYFDVDSATIAGEPYLRSH